MRKARRLMHDFGGRKAPSRILATGRVCLIDAGTLQ
jgi:hypothetical protein